MQAAESSKNKAAGQQFLRLAIYRTSRQVDAHSVRLSSQVNVDQGDQGRQFHGMADADRDERQEILPGDERDFERTLEPDKEERALHQDLDRERWMPQASLGSKKRCPRDQRERCPTRIRNT